MSAYDHSIASKDGAGTGKLNTGEPAADITVVPKRAGSGAHAGQHAPCDKGAVFKVNEVNTGWFRTDAPLCMVTLTHAGGCLRWSPSSGKDRIIIGRSATSNIVVKHDDVSRIHGFITIVDKGCVYVDNSRNGSAVLVGGSLMRLSHAGTVISGSGTIYVGFDPSDGIYNEECVIKYDVSFD